jgi:preprotein translocase subunit SecB
MQTDLLFIVNKNEVDDLKLRTSIKIRAKAKSGQKTLFWLNVDEV